MMFVVIVTIAISFAEAFVLNPATTPEQIIESQLIALKKDDMAGVYEFASPNNKAQTGSIDKFGQMVRSGPYTYLVGHEESAILLESTLGASKQFLVRVIPSDPKKTAVEYWWSLSRCRTGENQGCFMVDAVIPNS